MGYSNTVSLVTYLSLKLQKYGKTLLQKDFNWLTNPDLYITWVILYYTHKRKLKQLNSKDVSDSQVLYSKSTRSSTASRDPASLTATTFYDQVCVVCGSKKHNGVYYKYRISEEGRATKFLIASLYFLDEVYTRTCDLHDPAAVFGADLYCHKNCIRSYLQKYDKSLKKNESNSKAADKNWFKTVVMGKSQWHSSSLSKQFDWHQKYCVDHDQHHYQNRATIRILL